MDTSVVQEHLKTARSIHRFLLGVFVFVVPGRESHPSEKDSGVTELPVAKVDSDEIIYPSVG